MKVTTNPDKEYVKEIREKLADITGKDGLISINVGSTHAHSGIDTQGLWGNIPKTGRDEGYMDRVVEKVSEAIREAYTNRTEGSLYYSEESHPELFYDNRDPLRLLPVQYNRGSHLKFQYCSSRDLWGEHQSL